MKLINTPLINHQLNRKEKKIDITHSIYAIKKNVKYERHNKIDSTYTAPNNQWVIKQDLSC